VGEAAAGEDSVVGAEVEVEAAGSLAAVGAVAVGSHAAVGAVVAGSLGADVGAGVEAVDFRGVAAEGGAGGN